MAITLTTAYLNELKKGSNTPDTILEFAFDSGTVKYGFASGNNFSDVKPIIKSVSSLQNKLDTTKAYSTRGSLRIVLVGRNNFKNLIKDEYLKNRRVTRKDGFIAAGFIYSDYASTFTGLISEWSRKGDELTITVTDDMAEGQKKIPTPNATKTQNIDYTNSGAGMNPVDIMQDIIKTQLGVSASYVDDAQFDNEQATWYNGWKFSRVLTEPKDANKYLNELQIETGSFIVHDGEKITFKAFAPPVPGSVAPEIWEDSIEIIKDSLSVKSGYTNHFYNQIIFYFDYNEKGDYESILIDDDTDSQTLWGEVKTKTIKARWIRSFTHIQPTNVTGVKIYYTSYNNGAGDGTLNFTYDAGGEHTLQWTASGGTIGSAVVISKDGKFQVFDADETKYIRVVVTNGSLVGSNKSDSITISALNGVGYATAVARKILNHYRDPISIVAFDIDINNVAYNSTFIKPTDFKYLTTDEAFEKGEDTWVRELMMLTSTRLDFTNHRVRIEAIEAKMYHKSGFIAPNGYPDWDSATEAQQEYAFIGDSVNNQLGIGNDPGFYII